MKPASYHVTVPGDLLQRGFWLYIWEITAKDGQVQHYVGRTGDKPSGFSQSPFDRLSKHLGSNEKNNALTRHLEKKGLRKDECSFQFHAYGPILTEAGLSHGESCDIASAIECQLAKAMKLAGYDLLNHVSSRMPLNEGLWQEVKAGFGTKFPRLREESESRV